MRRVASSMNAMRKVFRRRRPSVTLGPCITSLIQSSPASRKAKRRRSVATGSPGRLSNRPSPESSRCTVEGASGVLDPVLAGGLDKRFDRESAGCSVLSEMSSSATSGGMRRGRPRSARVFGYSASNPPVRYRLSQSRMGLDGDAGAARAGGWCRCAGPCGAGCGESRGCPGAGAAPRR